MKIVITGHLGGLGKELYNISTSKNYHVVGFDLKSGKDISQPDVQTELLVELSDADVFINNAYVPDVQTSLLKTVTSHWINKNKLIITICSTMALLNTDDLHTDDDFPNKYVSDKKEQLSFARSHQGLPNIMTVVPGWIDTELVSSIKGVEKLNPNVLASLIVNQIDNINNFYISEIIVDPAGENNK